MDNSFYVQSYHATCLRWAQGCGDREWHDWAEEVGKIKQAWKWSVNGMLTQVDRDDPEIWYALGDAYYSGHGIERNLGQAEKWLRKAAEAGHVRSMTKLGIFLSHTDRSEGQLRESIEWYRRAAELGDSQGMTSLGFAYREGRGVEADGRKAADLFIAAYHKGNKYAAYLAGGVLSNRAENHLEAVKWLLLAVENGHDIANYDLAFIYENRSSAAYDSTAAFHCWLQVANRSSGSCRFMAMFKMVHFNRDGIATTPNRDEAKRWLNRILTTAREGSSDYRLALKLLRQMDDELF
jgi:TPR repeat protein